MEVTIGVQNVARELTVETDSPTSRSPRPSRPRSPTAACCACTDNRGRSVFVPGRRHRLGPGRRLREGPGRLHPVTAAHARRRDALRQVRAGRRRPRGTRFVSAPGLRAPETAARRRRSRRSSGPADPRRSAPWASARSSARSSSAPSSGSSARLVLPGKQNISAAHHGHPRRPGRPDRLLVWRPARRKGDTGGIDWIRWFISHRRRRAARGRLRVDHRQEAGLTPHHPNATAAPVLTAGAAGRVAGRPVTARSPGQRVRSSRPRRSDAVRRSGGQAEARHPLGVVVGEPGEHLAHLGQVDARRRRAAPTCASRSTATRCACDSASPSSRRPHRASRPPAVRSVLRVSRTTPTTKSDSPGVVERASHHLAGVVVDEDRRSRGRSPWRCRRRRRP